MLCLILANFLTHFAPKSVKGSKARGMLPWKGFPEILCAVLQTLGSSTLNDTVGEFSFSRNPGRMRAIITTIV